MVAVCRGLCRQRQALIPLTIYAVSLINKVLLTQPRHLMDSACTALPKLKRLQLPSPFIRVAVVSNWNPGGEAIGNPNRFSNGFLNPASGAGKPRA
jgi:hypothetical protein